MTFSNRYERQVRLPELGKAGQVKLSQARILMIGAGGLGSPALLYLAAAGIGQITIVDGDTIDETNLHRQILFSENHIGQNKAAATKNILTQKNSEITIKAIETNLSAFNAKDLFLNHDIIIDGTDNFDTKFLINDAAVKYKKPFVYGSILGFEGQIASFYPAQGTACYRCLFPEKPPQDILNCADAGIIGAVAGVLGSMQAMEAIKIILDNPNLKPLYNTLIQLNMRTMQSKTLAIKPDPNCKTCSAQSKTITLKETNMTETLLAAQALEQVEANENAVLVDVRELEEWHQGHIEGALHAPLSQMLQGNTDNLPKDKALYLYCVAGIRSKQAADYLTSQGFENCINISNGYPGLLAA